MISSSLHDASGLLALLLLVLVAAPGACQLQSHLNVTLLGALPAPLGASSYLSLDASVLIHVTASNISAFDTLTGAMRWALPVTGPVCPAEVPGSGSMGSLSGSYTPFALPVYVHPDPATCPEIALIAGCGSSITAISYAGASTPLYSAEEPLVAVVVGLGTLYHQAARRTVVYAVFGGTGEVVALAPKDGKKPFDFSALYTVLWRTVLSSNGLSSLVTVSMQTATDLQRNVSLVSIIVVGGAHTNITALDASDGHALAVQCLPVMSFSSPPLVSLTVAAWGNAWNLPSSLVVLDLVTGDTWVYYTVFDIDLFTPMPNTNSFIVGSFDQIVRLDAIARQPVWTYFNGNMFTFLSYDASDAVVSLWNVQSNTVRLVNGTTGALIAASMYQQGSSICVEPSGTRAAFAGVSFTNNFVLALSCNDTFGYGLRAVPRSSGDTLLPLLPTQTVSLAGVPATFADAPTMSTLTLQGRRLVLLTMPSVATLLYSVTLAAVPVTPTPTPTAVPGTTPTNVNTAVVPSVPLTTGLPLSTQPPSPTSATSPPRPLSSPQNPLGYILGALAGVGLAMLVAACMVILWRLLPCHRRRPSTELEESVNVDYFLAVVAVDTAAE